MNPVLFIYLKKKKKQEHLEKQIISLLFQIF